MYHVKGAYTKGTLPYSELKAPILNITISELTVELNPNVSHIGRSYITFEVFDDRNHKRVRVAVITVSTSVGELQAAQTKLALGIQPTVSFLREDL